MKTIARKVTRNIFLIASLCLLTATPSYAGIYKWTDDEGVVHYGEKPGNTSAEKIDIRQNETTKTRVPKAKKADENENPEAEGTEQTTAEPEKPAEPVEPAISKKEKARLCQEAKSDYATIISRGRLREINKKGEHIYLSEQQRQQRLAAAKKKQGEFCR